ncbi:mannose-1-phosphate guanylyltransferase/mannose-6-phosphate isomerase [Pseudoalteromonas denitrificans]|uniref:mannose-1-phosphate guanylyltransferase n=1 Tax=Pseudoalteromonas denitrificans DSM 6059 TaxID=1123010 RepID=A0A1I1UWJ9_9GAMM|nr:mannose-1-phosphate guanylyltransferase/mannose-6-phosphate isomerase [Pseudoalteromonas denitrificans]SFD75192.1 mannose-1-phosphate guanylyltransferase (GDP) /mannose-6-phosphate isomerase, type 2 [Pseudoalteromonas denitrificans DSM 6059]
MFIPVIMAGGSGTRLWPLSRTNYPKQFLNLTHSDETMLQQTINRLNGLNCGAPFIICNEEHRFVTAEQVLQLGVEHGGILLEPIGKNTAPTIALAALKAVKENSDATLLVLAADHVIHDKKAFQTSVKHAYEYTKNGKLVTFGIVANSPETGYGYIKRGAESGSKGLAYIVDSFIEKPDFKMANEYVTSGDYYWNSGLFMFKASRYLEELKKFRPDIYKACVKAMESQVTDMDFIRIDKQAFMACPEDSIDYAIMEPLCNERLDSVVVVPMDAGWNDVGSFDALWEVSNKDKNGNVLTGDVKVDNTQNTLIISEDKLVTTIGIEDLMIVNTKDTVLVAHKDKAQEIKTIVNELKTEKRAEVSNHREVYRPWGKYDCIDTGENFQVKRITVKPGERISLQKHLHRSEHWIVVSGTAKVTNGDKTFLVTENESTYIPLGQVHALENPGVLPLELIEVQTGSYLAEDDIVRFDDKYGRG